MSLRFTLGALALSITSLSLPAETIRVAIGTQDTTINCATGGLLIRELKLLEKHLPKDGKYQNVDYDIQWKNFTSGAPLTNEMVAGKLDLGSMADFPGSFNGLAFEKAGKKSLFLNVLSGSTQGSGNGIVVPLNSQIQTLADLKGKQVSVPFASTSHGMLLRALKGAGLNPDTDLTIIAQPPEVAGPALQAGKIDAHADFVPFAELFPFRGFARKIFDGSEAKTPTFHGSLVAADYARQYPEIVVAYLQAALEADRLFAAEPEKYSELIEKITGVNAEVAYLFHGPLGLQTRDLSWKPEYRQALATAIETLRELKKADKALDINGFIDDRFIRQAFKAAGRDYDSALTNYQQLPLQAKDALTGETITNFKNVAQLWVKGEAKVRSYGRIEHALTERQSLQKQGKNLRVIYAQDANSGIKLLAEQAWFATDKQGQLHAFLQPAAARQFAEQQQGKVVDYAGAEALVAH